MQAEKFWWKAKTFKEPPSKKKKTYGKEIETDKMGKKQKLTKKKK